MLNLSVCFQNRDQCLLFNVVLVFGFFSLLYLLLQHNSGKQMTGEHLFAVVHFPLGYCKYVRLCGTFISTFSSLQIYILCVYALQYIIGLNTSKNHSVLLSGHGHEWRGDSEGLLLPRCNDGQHSPFKVAIY